MQYFRFFIVSAFLILLAFFWGPVNAFPGNTMIIASNALALGPAAKPITAKKQELKFRAGSLQFLFKKKLNELDSSGKISFLGSTVVKSKDLFAFYKIRESKPAWLDQDNKGKPVKAAWQLLEALGNCDQEGLEPNDYNQTLIDSLLKLYHRKMFWGENPSATVSVELELLLTDQYLKFAHDLLWGRVRPKIPQDIWHVAQEKIDLATYLDKALSEKIDLRSSLKALTPPQEEYGKMKYWLREYRELAKKGGWEPIPEGLPLGLHNENSRVEKLCERLKKTGEMKNGICGDSFTPEIETALKYFQKSHGLDTSGTLDLLTLKSLNIPIADRIEQIELNLDCWRWLPQDLGEKHIRVNIANYRMGIYEKGKEIFSMKVVVGRKQDSTPVFSDRIVSVQLNPYWNVPASISGEELLPELKKDVGYLGKHNMELLSDWSDTATPIKAESIDWNTISEEKFPFRIKQKNGDASALGRIKFVLTNPYNIYLHDTPAKKYFDFDNRALSHGCVRVSDPMKLAIWVLNSDKESRKDSDFKNKDDEEKNKGGNEKVLPWTSEQISASLLKGDEIFITVPGKGIPVHILYRTSFVDNEGGLQFRPDIYNWNKKMESALLKNSNSF